MSKITAKLDKGNIVITIPATTKNLEVSESGKTMRVASSEGFKETDLKVDGKSVFVNLHAFVYVNEKKPKK
jgi:hypothetical protein